MTSPPRRESGKNAAYGIKAYDLDERVNASLPFGIAAGSQNVLGGYVVSRRETWEQQEESHGFVALGAGLSCLPARCSHGARGGRNPYRLSPPPDSSRRVLVVISSSTRSRRTFTFGEEKHQH